MKSAAPFHRVLVALIVISAAGCSRLPSADTEALPKANEKASTLADPTTKGGRWFVAAANPYAVEAGAQVLARGGTAVDAAVAVQTVLGLVEPQSSGLGGGAFMMHFDPASGVLETYDGRETAPASATANRFLTERGEAMNYYDAVAGGLSIGVPGVVRMLGMAHKEHGAVQWAELMHSATMLAEEGFQVSPRLNAALGRIPRLKQTKAAADYFYDTDGNPHPVGHKLKNPDYAETLRILGREGADSFYSGPIAAAIVAAVNAAPNPGGMTLDDIARYQPIKREAVCGGYRGRKLCSMGPPSSGGVTLLQILAMLERFDMAGAGAGSIEALHLLLEASRLAYADRDQYLADQDQFSGSTGDSVTNLVDGLLDATYLGERSALIDPLRAAPEVSAGDPFGKKETLGADASAEPPSTSHFVVMDGAGRVVSMTTTVEFAFGSHQMAAGMILNNQLTDFSFLPERNGRPVANAVAPGKRPRSSMTPVIMFNDDGSVFGALGSPGGPAIIGFVAKTVIGVVDWGLSLQAAIDFPHVVIPRGGAILEKGKYDAQVINGLRSLGHEIVERDLESGLHGFVIGPDGVAGAADPRREGAWRTGVVGDDATR